MRILAPFFLFFFLVLWSSCRSDFESSESMGNLVFSKDTVFLDTVFTGRTSSTYSLKVYNKSATDIHIPRIQLARGEASAYRLNVDGIPGKAFENIEILGRDSVYIFIETTVDFQESDQEQFLYEDQLQFISSAHTQEVPLLTLAKDAIFLYPSRDDQGNTQTVAWGKDEDGKEVRVPGFLLTEDHLNFTRSKAYVIYGYAVIPPGRSLSIAPGSRIHFHENSGLIVSEGATLNVNGGFSENRVKLENEVIFQGDRLQSSFDQVPGQWGTILIQAGSLNNFIEYATIKNASVGLSVHGEPESDNSLLQVKNTQIYNSAVHGIRGVSAHISADNLVVNNSGRASVYLSGGRYTFRHTTIANYWTAGYRDFPALQIDNKLETSNNIQYLPVDQAHFQNCIIYGNNRQELGLTKEDNLPFELLFQNCLIRFEPSTGSPSPLYGFSSAPYYENVILNKDPFFWAPRENDMRLQANSSAVDQGKNSTAEAVPYDLLQVSRLADPDLGAYERTDENK